MIDCMLNTMFFLESGFLFLSFMYFPFHLFPIFRKLCIWKGKLSVFFFEYSIWK